MYSEKDFKRHILWIRIKRLLFLFVFSVIGCAIGVISSSYIVDILLFDWNLKPIIIASSTILFFLISLILTSNSSRYIQDCLWKIETLRTLNGLSEKLDDIKNIEKAEQLSNSISTLKDSLVGDTNLLENSKKQEENNNQEKNEDKTKNNNNEKKGSEKSNNNKSNNKKSSNNKKKKKKKK